MAGKMCGDPGCHDESTTFICDRFHPEQDFPHAFHSRRDVISWSGFHLLGLFHNFL